MDTGKAMTALAYQKLARHLAAVFQMCRGSFLRKRILSHTCEAMVEKVIAGKYDDELERMMEDLDDEVTEGD